MPETSSTIGHHRRTLTDVIELHRGSLVESVVDVRRFPGPARYPHFDQDTLSTALDRLAIRYRHVEGLTGRRPVSKDVPFEVNAWWKNRSFHNYAAHALSDNFRGAL